jgi:diguanylate cyclase (GGDEF)-like protein
MQLAATPPFDARTDAGRRLAAPSAPGSVRRPARTRWLSVLADALREITAAPTLDAALERMVGVLVLAFDFESVAFFSHDPGAGILRATHRRGRHHDGDETQPGELTWVTGQGLLGRAAATREAVVTGDVQRAAGYVLHYPDTASEIAVPLVDGDELIGVLDVQSRERRFFSPTAVEVVQAIAAQVVVARQVAQLREAQARRLEEQRAVHEASLDLLDARPEEETLARVVSSARRLLGALGASVALVDPGQHELVVKVAVGLAMPLGTRIPLGLGVQGAVVERGEPIAVDDYASWEHRIREPWADEWGSVAAVPLRIDDVVLGTILVVADRPDRGFGEDDLRLLGLLAAPAALAIRNAAQTAERHADLRAVAGVARTLSSETDVSRIRQAIVAVAARVMGSTKTLLMEPDGEGWLRVSAAVGDVAIPALRIDDPVAATSRSFRTGQAIFLDDALGSPDANQSIVRRAGARALYIQPVIREGVPLGVLLSEWAKPRGEVTERVRTLLALLATDAAIAIARAQLVEWLDGMAHRDALTGAANRRAWDEELPSRLEAARVEDEPVCMAMLDFDLFKIFNDVQGHQRGDLLLRHAVAAWARELGEGDLLARYGGEEFAVLLRGRDLHSARAVIERLRAAVPDRQTCSAGLAPWDGEESPEALVARADAALYAAKHAGRDRVVVALGDDASVPSGSPLRTGWTRWTAVIPRLLDDRAVRSAYQPVVRLADVRWAGGEPVGRTDAIVGYEALARVGPSPSETASVEGLFAAAQYRGLGRDMDWLCRRAALAGAAGMPQGSALFVNVGVSTLLDPLHGIDQMELLLRWAGRRSSEVVLEITEREAVRDAAALRAVIDLYRESGFRFAVDDVGEGHSTLEVLAAATPEFVKVARTLVAAVELPGPRAAIRAVVAFARACGAQVVAEGIESRADLERMTELGVELGQGYGLERPSFQPTGFGSAALRAPLKASA